MTNLPVDSSAPLPHFRRSIDAAMVEHEGEPMLMLRDAEGITEHVMLVSPSALMVITLMDGRNSLSDIKALIMKRTGVALPEMGLASLVSEFQKLHFMENEETAALRRASREEFSASPVRKPALAGISYPRDREGAERFIGEALKAEGAPPDDMSAPFAGAPAGLVAPHIDIMRGARCYARAYKTLQKCARPDVIIAVGVAHAGPDAPWVLTDKRYQTPLGEMPADADMVRALSGCLWYDRRADEMVHKTEHSLEYQALWLKHIWGGDAPPWVPVLASDFTRFAPERPPESGSSAGAGLDKMCAVLSAEAAKGRKIMVLAAVDLSHVNLKEEGNSPEQTEGRDKASLELALRPDPDGFYRDVCAGGNPRSVCGLSALYTAARFIAAVSPQARGKLLDYAVSQDPAGGAVSFAAAIYG
ncbi:MAG: AmmeMemoRadiSam system protein B [Elusimicrobiales bacterium]